MRRPVILLPPSKGKATGGVGPRYAATLGRHPLAGARAAVLEAATSAAEGDDATVARRCGVPIGDVASARRTLRTLADAPTLPAGQRYRGVVHGNAGLAQVDVDRSGATVLIVSALLGLVALGEPVPFYRLEFSATLPGIGGVASFWRDHLLEELLRVAGGSRVWDLLPAEHGRMWPAGLREELSVVGTRFIRPGGGAANAARTKVAKGLLTAHLLEAPATTPAGVVRAVAAARAHDVPGPLGPGWVAELVEEDLVATYVGE